MSTKHKYGSECSVLAIQAYWQQSDQKNDELLAAFLKGSKDGATDFNCYGVQLIQLQMLREMTAIDHERAITAVRAWSKFIESGSGRQHHVAFETLESYLPYRIRDVGEMFWYGMMTFGLAITIPEAEDEICKRLVGPAFAVLCLTNDLFSWEKEHQSAFQRGSDSVPNAIWVLMREHSIGVEEAKGMCRRVIKQKVSEYLDIVEQNRGNTNLSPDLRRYLDAMQYTLSGNAVWSLDSPRYKSFGNHADLQKPILHGGVAAKSEGKLTTTHDQEYATPDITFFAVGTTKL
ncbi:MAG: hypothetical protein Q9178_005603 [Gyalolechia marmorata]